MGPLEFLRFLPTSAIGNALNLPGENLPFLPARFAANMAKQAFKPDYPNVPLPIRMMNAMPPQVVMGRIADAVGMPKTGYPVPVRAVQGALALLQGLNRPQPQLDQLSPPSNSCSSGNPFSCFFGGR